ncbi:MAG: tetratricopeptide repeat protein [Flavobacteriales bacterium]|nr:tetratricopeptide repeat protein [Flavobacteriales bacterium]
MKNLILICILFPCLSSLAQNVNEAKKIDSLNQILNSTNNKEELASAYFEKSKISKRDSAIVLQNKAIDILNSQGNNKNLDLLSNLYLYLGHNHISKGNYQDAIEPLTQALNGFENLKDTAMQAKCYNYLAMSYRNTRGYSRAVQYFKKSFTLSQIAGNQILSSAILINMGDVYGEQLNIEAALKNYKESLIIKKKINHKPGIGNCYLRIGNVYLSQKKYDAARLNFEKALEIFEKIDYQINLSNAYSYMGKINLAEGDYNSAESYAQKALDIAIKTNQKSTIFYALSFLNEVYNKKGSPRMGLKFGQEALNLYDSIYSRSKYKVYKNIQSSYISLHDYKNAYKYHMLYIINKDSAINQENKKEAYAVKIEADYVKQHLTDSLAFTQKEKLKQIEHSAQLEEEENQRYILYGSLIFFLFLGGLAFRGYQRKKKDNPIIIKQKEEVELAHIELEEKSQEIMDSINYAERIQRSFLATEELLNENLGEHFVFFQPKEAVSGDFYWAGKLANGNFAMVNADSTGHGVPGAIMSILNISSIEKAIEKGLTKPSEIFNDTRKTIIERLKKDGSEEGGKDGMDASIISFDFKNANFSFTAAQNPIWIIRKGELIEIKPEKMPIGKHNNDTIPFVGGEFETKKGDIIYTLTDGFQDQFGGPKGKKFMIKKMREYILSISHLPMNQQHQKIKETFNTWKGNLEQIDDVCILGVKI